MASQESADETQQTEQAAATTSPPAEASRKPNIMRRLYDWVLSWADTRYGTPALAVLSFVESSFFPIPPDPLLLGLAFGRPRRAPLYALVCTIASVLGGLLGYWIGFAAFETVGQWVLDTYGKHDLYETLRGKFSDYSFWSILVAALTPIPYKIFTIAAGSFEIDLTTFIVASVVGRGARFFGVAMLVFFFGERVRPFIDRYFEPLVILFTILLIGGFVVIKYVM